MRNLLNDIFPTEPCPNVIDPTQVGTRALPRAEHSNGANREIRIEFATAPDHNNLRASSRVKEGFDMGIKH